MPTQPPYPVPPEGTAATHSPTGERLTSCGSCGATIYFVRTPRGAVMPVSLATGRNHYLDCPQANAWSRHKTRQSRPTGGRT